MSRRFCPSRVLGSECLADFALRGSSDANVSQIWPFEGARKRMSRRFCPSRVLGNECLADFALRRSSEAN
eukprot:1022006-Alexandrium_andersonii.AAC.1